MKGNFSWHGFATRDELASAFAAVVASHLAEAIAERGEASMTVRIGFAGPGSITPSKVARFSVPSICSAKKRASTIRVIESVRRGSPALAA